MQQSSVFDCSVLDMGKLSNPNGNITVVENGRNIPFDVRRIYYLYDIPGGEVRGGHAHKELQQVVIAASGSFDVAIDDGTNKRTFQLNRPYYGLLLPSGLWREISNFSSGAICLVLSSELYSMEDYIREYGAFKQFKGLK